MDKYQQSHKDKLFKTSTHDPYCSQRAASCKSIEMKSFT